MKGGVTGKETQMNRGVVSGWSGSRRGKAGQGVPQGRVLGWDLIRERRESSGAEGVGLPWEAGGGLAAWQVRRGRWVIVGEGRGTGGGHQG